MESADRQRFVSFSLVPTAMSRPVVLVLATELLRFAEVTSSPQR